MRNSDTRNPLLICTMHIDHSIPEQDDPDWGAVSARPIVESGQPLIDTGDADERIATDPAYARMGFAHALPRCHVRQGLLERLIAAARALPDCLQLLVLDGWRPVALQSALYDDFSRQIGVRFPELDAAGHAARTRQFVAPPSADPAAPSPHLTGGSVDLTLASTDGEPLDMGTAFDEPSLLSRTAALETAAGSDSRRARDNRRLLFHVMHNAGFTNLASEWWHFDYGNQLWATALGRPHAIYGATSL